MLLKDNISVCLYTTCLPGTLEQHKRASDILELLQVIVNHHVGAVN